jgi:hypothetical protein
MFKDVLTHADLAHWATMGLVVFFVTFIGIALWTLTRPRRDIDRWSSLPLQSDEVTQESRP